MLVVMGQDDVLIYRRHVIVNTQVRQLRPILRWR